MSDGQDQPTNDASTEHDAAERTSFPPAPGPAGVRRPAVHRRRLYVSLAVLAAVLIAVPMALIAANVGSDDSPPVTIGSSSPTVPASPAPSLTPTAAPTATTPAEVLNATLTLPAFPGLADECDQSGRRSFVDGVADLGDSVRWTIGQMVPIRANLDGVAGDELLTTIRCDTEGSVHVTQLLALKVGAGGGLSFLGYVINSPDVRNLAFESDKVRVEAGVVLVTTSGPSQSDGWPPCHHQIRGYAYQGGAFKQVSGPTSFPDPAKDIHHVDFRNIGLLISIADPTGDGGTVYCVPMVNGTGSANVYIDGDQAKGSVPYTFTIGPVAFIADKTGGEFAVAVVTLRPQGGGSAGYSVQLFRSSDDLVGQVLQQSGHDGVTSIEKVTVSGDELIVSLTVGARAETWTYRQSADTGGWKRT